MRGWFDKEAVLRGLIGQVKTPMHLQDDAQIPKQLELVLLVDQRNGSYESETPYQNNTYCK